MKAEPNDVPLPDVVIKEEDDIPAEKSDVVIREENDPSAAKSVSYVPCNQPVKRKLTTLVLILIFLGLPKLKWIRLSLVSLERPAS